MELSFKIHWQGQTGYANPKTVAAAAAAPAAAAVAAAAPASIVPPALVACPNPEAVISYLSLQADVFLHLLKKD